MKLMANYWPRSGNRFKT